MSWLSTGVRRGSAAAVGRRQAEPLGRSVVRVPQWGRLRSCRRPRAAPDPGPDSLPLRRAPKRAPGRRRRVRARAGVGRQSSAAGRRSGPVGESSNPTTDSRSGTEMPASWAARRVPRASWSLKAKMVVGRSGRASNCAAPSAPASGSGGALHDRHLRPGDAGLPGGGGRARDPLPGHLIADGALAGRVRPAMAAVGDPRGLQPAGIAAPTGAPLTAGPYPAGPARRSAAETPPAHCTDDTRRWAAVAESILPLTLPDRRPRREIAPGAVHVPGWLSIEQQRRLVVACSGWAAGPVPIRAARLPGGHVMSVRTVCLGWHWQPYRYTP